MDTKFPGMAKETQWKWEDVGTPLPELTNLSPREGNWGALGEAPGQTELWTAGRRVLAPDSFVTDQKKAVAPISTCTQIQASAGWGTDTQGPSGAMAWGRGPVWLEGGFCPGPVSWGRVPRNREVGLGYQHCPSEGHRQAWARAPLGSSR